MLAVLLAPTVFFTQSLGGVADQILDQFRSHAIVGLSELHRSKEDHVFIEKLIQSPRFGEVVDDIVVECGNPLYQEIMDRYVAGFSVDRDILQRAWRNTSQWLVWDSPVYEQFFKTVRDSNFGRRKKVRVVLGDSPIDWSKVRTADQYKPFATRDDFYFATVDRLVKRRHKVLLVIGGMHLLKQDIRGNRVAKVPGAPNLPSLQTRYRDKLYVVWTITGPSTLMDFIRPTSYPALTSVADTGLGQGSSKLILPQGIKFFGTVNGKASFYEPKESSMPLLKDVVDAFLVLPPHDSTVEARPATYRDKKYVSELRRRARILKAVFGFEFEPDLAELIDGSRRK